MCWRFKAICYGDKINLNMRCMKKALATNWRKDVYNF